MPVDPQVQAFLDHLHSVHPPQLDLQSGETLAQVLARLRQEPPVLTAPEPVHHVEDQTIAGPGGPLPIRMYIPEGTGLFPVLLFFHGGGFVTGSLQSQDSICRALTNATPCITVSVGYRLAPEHPYPAAVEDGYAALQWVAEHAASIQGDPSRIALTGTSAGGTLAAAVTLMARDRGGPRLLYQLLCYPETTHNHVRFPSFEEYGHGYFIEKEGILLADTWYVPLGADQDAPYAFPLSAKDLHHLPPALVITAEYDPLRDEGELYAQRLREAGVLVTLTRYDGMIHSFLNQADLFEEAKVAIAEAARTLHQAFTSEEQGVW